VSSRTYLSIGDVLTLLREEFPDVTISKIRFLESQGLVNPERSPSGYRKFFEHDVERLRWVLRQQREHFLPLKVIRDRLADGDLEEGADLVNGKSGDLHAAARVPRAEEQPTKADEEAMARILADASRRTANLPEAAQSRRGLQVVPDHAPSVASAGAAGGAEGPAERARAGVAASGRPAAAGAAAGPGGPPPRDVVAGPTDAHAPRPGGAGAGTPAPSPAPAGAPGAKQGQTTAPPPQPGADAGQGSKAPPVGATTGIVTGASLTVEELCGACGLSADELSGLESFGLIEPVMVAGIPTYDEDALSMAKVAAAFRAYGIEPRHLRSYRNSVDREVGLIEQVVIPLLRQRNPESRQRAVEAAEQLVSLGQSMRATLLRQALRRHLGG
jgi:DNA-binding transcriptional MerR regulator